MLTSRFGSGFAGVRENRMESAVAAAAAAARVGSGGACAVVSMKTLQIRWAWAIYQPTKHLFLGVLIPLLFITAETLMCPRHLCT
jgi:hypothetical protein